MLINQTISLLGCLGEGKVYQSKGKKNESVSIDSDGYNEENMKKNRLWEEGGKVEKQTSFFVFSFIKKDGSLRDVSGMSRCFCYFDGF